MLTAPERWLAKNQRVIVGSAFFIAAILAVFSGKVTIMLAVAVCGAGLIPVRDERAQLLRAGAMLAGAATILVMALAGIPA